MNRKTTRHILPILANELERLDALALPDAGGEREKRLEWCILANGYASLGVGRMKGTAARAGADITLHDMGAFSYADIDGAAGAVLGELAKAWHTSREDTLERCVPKTDGDASRLASVVGKARGKAA